MLNLITNLFSGFAGVLVGAFIAYLMNAQLEKKKQQMLCSVLNDILKQTKVILVGTFGSTKAISPYGYIKISHDVIQIIIPLFDNIISEIGILPPSKNKTRTIELYTELKGFLACNEKYAIKLEKLKKFRQEMLPKNFVTLNCKNYMDYFDLDDILFKEEKNQNSVISKDFFRAQKILIDDLNSVSHISWNMYLSLIEKIDAIINTSWEVKNDGK